MRALAVAIAVFAALLAAGPSVHAASTGKQFFRPVPTALAKVSRHRAPGVVSDVTPVAFNAGDMLGLSPGDEVELTLPGAAPRRVVFEQAQSHGGGIASWVGYFKERGNSNRVILTSGPGGSYGVIDTPEGSFRVIPGEGHDWLVDMAMEQLHLPVPVAQNDEVIPDDGPVSLPRAQSVARATAKAWPILNNVDLMVVVTRTLAAKLGANLMTRLYFLVTRANTTYLDSQVGMKLRLVSLAVVDYPDTTTNQVAIDAIRPVAGGGVGVFANIAAQAAAAGADLVSLMRDGSSFGGSGIAFLGGYQGQPFVPESMYSVITGCVAGCESVFIHELGHNMGNKHDRYTNAFQSGSAVGTFPYSFGYAFCKSGVLTCNPVISPTPAPGTCTTSQPECLDIAPPPHDPSNFRDIMAYFNASTAEVYRFSNPAITCAAAGGDGVARPCGIDRALANGADTAFSMNTRADAIRDVRAQVSAAQMPGSLQFTQTAFSASETGGTITFVVSRMRDSAIVGGGGAVSVDYTLTGGTATAGGDFIAASGTLNWADGDFANKTFAVTLVSDPGTEPVETFRATIANAAGAPGVFLGYPAIAAGIILEAWPPGGALPPGFVPDASASGWTVANDQSYEPAASVRSAQVFGDMTNYTNSDLVYAGPLAAGQAAFAYRVSSYQSYGVFEFILDGVTILSDTGETGWKVFLFDIVTTGNHTLTWRFKNRLNARCNLGWTPPAQGGAACADRVWIDALALPSSVIPDPPRLGNLSTRMQVLTGNDVMIGGFVIGGAASKTVVVRARGPSLVPFGIPNALANPTLTLVRSSDQVAIAVNDDWQGAANSSAITASGFAPSSALESAILVTLPPGAYTAIVSGVGGGTGVAIVEVFEVDEPGIPLINISTRGQVLTGNDVMIGGFVIQGPAPQTVVVRARGPSLIPYGITNALANPTLQLVRSSDQATIVFNDNWGTASNAAALGASGFAPDNSLEAAILVTLDPGAYTAIVTGVGGGTGVGIIEVFAQ